MSRKNQLVLGIIVGGFSIFISLFVLEIALRIILPTPNSKKPNQQLVHFPERPEHFYLPENAPSLRGNEGDIEKSKDTFRISVVGDSFTFGPKMQFFDAFPFKLQNLLDLHSGAKHAEVRSYGTPGASTKDEIALVDNAIKAQSDLIILQITLNDPQLEPYRKAPPDFDPTKTNSRIKKLLFHSALYRFIAQRVFNYTSYQRYIDYTEGLFHNKDTKDNFENSFKAIAALAKSHNTPLIVMTLPLYDFDFKKYPFADIHQQIASLSEDEKLPYLDMLSRFTGTDNTRLQVVPGVDNHPNEIAHRIIAESLYEFLVTKHLIDAEFGVNFFGYREAVFQREHSKKLLK